MHFDNYTCHMLVVMSPQALHFAGQKAVELAPRHGLQAVCCLFAKSRKLAQKFEMHVL